MDPEILESCEVRNYSKGAVVLSQNEQPDGMYVIKSGEVEVEMNGERIAHLKEGDFFGEMGMLLKEPRNATIRVTSEELTTLFLSKENFAKERKEVQQEIIAKLLERTGANLER